MTDRERFKRFTHFQGVDRPVRWEWAFRKDTTQLWYEQGLPANVPDCISMVDYFHLDHGAPFCNETVPTKIDINFVPLPSLGGLVVEQDETYVVTRDLWGNLGKSLRNAKHHSIPQYCGSYVNTADDFRRLKEMLDPADPSRYPADWEQLKTAWKKRDYPVFLKIHGWYGVLREMMGVEGLSIAFYDEPALIEEIAEFWGDYIISLFEKAVNEVDVDYVLFWEDLAFKTGPLLSPALFRRFFLKHYIRVISHLRSKGIDTFMVDSDGNIESIIPMWLEAGIGIIGPFEVTAGMDVVKIGNTYKELVIVGGINKMEIALGSGAIEQEVAKRVYPLISRGGYIPTLDHATIPELSLKDFIYYREFLKKIYG